MATWIDAVEVLKAADRGDIGYEYEIGVPWEYCGTPTYKIAGWEFGIFDDCGEWDYIEWATAPDGTRLDADTTDDSLDYWGYRPDGVLDESYNRQVGIAS